MWSVVPTQHVPPANLLPSASLRLCCDSPCGKGDLRLCGWCRHSWPVIRRYPRGPPPALDIPLEPQLPGPSSPCSPAVYRKGTLYSLSPPAQRVCFQPRSFPLPPLPPPPLRSLSHTELLNLEPTQVSIPKDQKRQQKQTGLSVTIFISGF